VIAVPGATRTVGRQVVTQLSERRLPVRAITRDPAPAGLAESVEAVRGDLADPAAAVSRSSRRAARTARAWVIKALGPRNTASETDIPRAGLLNTLRGFPEYPIQVSRGRYLPM
jgi:nucleoside-diphosphate-sugar epimerase